MRGHVLVSEHPVHPPPTSENPWECDVPSPKNYFFEMKSGVFNVFKKKGDKDILYTFPDLNTFVSDTQQMCTMIADGPL